MNVAVGADPVDDALPEADPVIDAVAVADEDGVILGPGPAVIMSPLPPGYVAPAAATKS